MSQATSSTLSVAVTCDRTGYLSESVAESILQQIRNKIFAESVAQYNWNTPRPTFSSQQLYADGVIKLFCADNESLTWLKKTVSGLNFRNIQLVVKTQSEIQNQVRCQFEIPVEQLDVVNADNCVKEILCYQNSWIDVRRWTFPEPIKANKSCLKVMMLVPGDQIPTLMKADCRLSIGLTVVYIKFEGPDGEFNSNVPKGWDPKKVVEVSTADYRTFLIAP